MPSRFLLAALLFTAHASAQAFSCAPTGGDECRLELSTVTIVFDAGVYNFNGETQFIGTDGYVNGYTTGSGDFPELTPIDTNGGLRAGFGFAPPMYGQVGGSGFEGYHEASASFLFVGMAFVAKPGFQVDGVELTVTGTRTSAGNGYVGLTVPGIPTFDGDQFTGSAVLDPFSAQAFGAGFTINAYYEEGEDGGAAAFGTASAALTSARLLVHVSAVPEASAYALMLAGLGLVGWAARRRTPA